VYWGSCRARRLVKIKEAKGWQGVVAGTRKITPGFRLVEKHAMLVGGADAHRMDLSSMVMLKDNHIWSHGSITKAVAAARAVCGFSMKIEVETSSLDEAREVSWVHTPCRSVV
jgi:nicotinate-nucleotide pyrophosphorylase (carboxylating)